MRPCDCWLGPGHKQAVHLLDRPDRLHQFGRGLCRRRHLLAQPLRYVRVSLQTQPGAYHKSLFFSFLFICVSWTQEPEELFETISQAILNAFDRDALSGWGAVVHVMYKISPSSKLFLFFSKTRHKQIQYTQLGHHSHAQDPHGLKTIKRKSSTRPCSLLFKLS